MTDDLFDQATNPKQYDLEALYWQEMGAANSPYRQFFKEYLFADEDRFKNKDVLDVGSGTGWLLAEMHKHGAKSVLGIEPSEHNVAIAQRGYPDVTTILSSLEEFATDKQYDAITAIMVMVHIRNVDAAMTKLASLLRSEGTLYLIVPPYEYTKTPRFDYKIDVEYLNDDEYVASVTRSNGVLVDIVRKTGVYQKSAAAHGLTPTKKIDLTPTAHLLSQEPKYEEFKHQAIAELLLFQKTSV